MDREVIPLTLEQEKAIYTKLLDKLAHIGPVLLAEITALPNQVYAKNYSKPVPFDYHLKLDFFIDMKSALDHVFPRDRLFRSIRKLVSKNVPRQNLQDIIDNPNKPFCIQVYHVGFLTNDIDMALEDGKQEVIKHMKGDPGEMTVDPKFIDVVNKFKMYKRLKDTPNLDPDDYGIITSILGTSDKT